jgi:uncharacterized protein (DUF1499 family)
MRRPRITTITQKVRRIMLWLLAAAGGLLLALGIAIAMQVDDWRRDLSQNEAATSPDAADPRLRPLRVACEPAELARRVREAVARLPCWRVTGECAEDGEIVMTLERTSRLLRFTDDVTVRIRPEAGSAELSAHSRSRVGKGDLGQNPRNLRELLDAFR